MGDIVESKCNKILMEFLSKVIQEYADVQCS